MTKAYPESVQNYINMQKKSCGCLIRHIWNGRKASTKSNTLKRKLAESTKSTSYGPNKEEQNVQTIFYAK